jgi:hypothetical protein
MSQSLSDSILPPAFGWSSDGSADPDHDWLEGRMGDLFDPFGAAEIAAGMVFRYLLEGERVTRIFQQNPDLSIIPVADIDRSVLPSLSTYLSTINAAIITSQTSQWHANHWRVHARDGAQCSEGVASQLPVLIANVYADRLLKMQIAEATYRVKTIVATHIDEARAMASAHSTMCNPSAAVEWNAIAEALSAGTRPIIPDLLSVPPGAPI